MQPQPRMPPDWFLTTRVSPEFVFFPVRGVLPLSLPGVLKSSATFLCRKWYEVPVHLNLAPRTYIWFSEKMSAMCSFSHSISFLTEKENSSTS